MGSFNEEGLDVQIEPFVLPQKHDLQSVPPFLADGRKINITVMGCEIEYDVEMESWNYPHAANTLREEPSVKSAKVSIEDADLALYTEDDEEIDSAKIPKELWKLLIAHAEEHFPIDDFHDALLEDYAEYGESDDSEDDHRHDD